MTNKEFLRKASKLQKEFAELYKGTGLIAVNGTQIHVKDDKFHELEKENLLEHISSELVEEDNYWRHEAMTPDGGKIIAIGCVSKLAKK